MFISTHQNSKDKLKMLLSELERYRAIFLEDRKNNFKNEYFLTSIDCHIEDLLILLDDD